MDQSKRNLLIVLSILIIMVFYWINRIESPFQRIFGILIVSSLSYWAGRLHGKILGIGADGKDPLLGPSFYIKNEK